ncbi:MAG TPA: AIR synthase-related protein, partial [Pyrinomonadaceae bacterium]|nr:AIR synthase-related protein [Pyrinomonadaceae bacterium]
RVEVRDDLDPDAHSIEQLLLRHIRPEPRVGWGLILGEERLASAMIDISDGLSSDLHHLCEESEVGTLVDAARIPIDPLVASLCGRRALDPLLLALHGGEDFELLFTVHPDNVTRLPKTVDGISISQIGEITNEPVRIRVAEKDRVWDLERKGFDHFRHNG